MNNTLVNELLSSPVISTLIAFLSIFITLIIGFITLLISQKKDKDDLKGKMAELSKHVERSFQCSDSRNISNDLGLLKFAQTCEDINRINVLGVNALGIVHQGYETIISLMSKKGLKIQILVIDPRGNVFSDRIISESSENKALYEVTCYRLLSEWNTTMMILSSISQKAKSKSTAKLEVKKHNTTMNIGMTAILSPQEVNSKAYINKYPSEGRGYTGKHFLCSMNADSERYTFKTAINKFEDLWDNGTVIKDYNAEIVDLNDFYEDWRGTLSTIPKK